MAADRARQAVAEIVANKLKLSRTDAAERFADRLLSELGADATQKSELLDRALLARLRRGAWSSNVRELRNYLERCLVLQQPAPLHDQTLQPTSGLRIDATAPYGEAKRRLLDTFEREYLLQLLDLHKGNVSRAARAAGMDRVYVHKLLHKHGIRRRSKR